MQAISRSQALIEFKLDGSIVSANENFLQVMGYSLAEVRGRHHSMFVDPAERESPAYAEFWRQLNLGEFKSAEFRGSPKAAGRSGFKRPTIRSWALGDAP
jgi:methyl-accepting chemotaxis protein